MQPRRPLDGGLADLRANQRDGRCPLRRRWPGAGIASPAVFEDHCPGLIVCPELIAPGMTEVTSGDISLEVCRRC
jgi:hypothetical protein